MKTMLPTAALAVALAAALPALGQEAQTPPSPTVIAPQPPAPAEAKATPSPDHVVTPSRARSGCGSKAKLTS